MLFSPSKSIRVLWIWFIRHHNHTHRRTTAIWPYYKKRWWCWWWRRRWWWRWLMMIMMMNCLLYEIQTHTEQMNANFTRTIQNNSQIFGVNPSIKVTKQQLNGDKWKHCTYPVAVYWMLGVSGRMLAIIVIRRAPIFHPATTDRTLEPRNSRCTAWNPNENIWWNRNHMSGSLLQWTVSHILEPI